MFDQLQTFINKLATLKPIDLAHYKQALNSEFIELQQMSECPQDNIWHAEGDVLTHTQMVMDEALKEIFTNPSLSYKDKVSIYLAALLHDIGKPATTYTTIDNRIISPSHSAVGLPLARKILLLLKVPFDIQHQVLRLILRHMVAYRMIKSLTPDYTINGINIEFKQYLRLASELSLPALYHLTRADWLGRVGSDIERTLAQVDVFRSRCQYHNLWNYTYDQFTEYLISQETLYKLGVLELKEQKRIQYLIFNLSLQGRIQSPEQALAYISEHNNILLPKTAHLYVMVGAPGSGKSTWAEKTLPNIEVISSDKKREELFNDVNWQNDNSQVFQKCHVDIDNELKANKPVIFDATNTQFSHRHTALQLAFNHYAHTTIVYFDLPLDEILSRNRQRNRQVPEGIISRYFNDLEVPLQTEAQELRIISLATDPIWNSPQIL